MSSLSARLDRIPFSRFHLRLLAIGGLGYVFDAMDVAIIAFVLPVMRVQWGLSSMHVGLLAAAASIGGIAGASIGGRIADRIGRRPIMMWALALYSLATFASALSHGWQSFLAWRVIAGVGTSAESAIVATFLAEFAGPSFRGRYVGALVSFFSLGFVAAAALGYTVIPTGPSSWRYALVITALPICMLLWWRRSLPESPRWLESKGRSHEAERIVTQIEEQCRRNGQDLPSPLPAEALPPPIRAPVHARHAMLFSSRFVRTTSMALTSWFAIGFAYYAFFTWIPSLLIDKGGTIAGSYASALVIYAAQIPGYLSATVLNDVIGRRAVTAGYMLFSAAAAMCLAVAGSNASLLLLAATAVSFFMNGCYAGIYAYTTESFPIEVRATANGLALSISRVAAAISPIVVGYSYSRLGLVGIFGLSSGILLCGAAAILILGTATRNLSLEAIGRTP